MITKKEVQHIANLARLGLNEKEIEKYQNELSSILDYIEKLKEVDISKVEPNIHPLEVKNVTREDKEKSKIKNQISKRLLELAPETKEGYLKVKSILK
jgi:aspartyl-tRNA(Asn)/glutamyl-tRNA(Gln) amidotransferase subunit C